jgi:hypothetical protein
LTNFSVNLQIVYFKKHKIKTFPHKTTNFNCPSSLNFKFRPLNLPKYTFLQWIITVFNFRPFLPITTHFQQFSSKISYINENWIQNFNKSGDSLSNPESSFTFTFTFKFKNAIPFHFCAFPDRIFGHQRSGGHNFSCKYLCLIYVSQMNLMVFRKKNAKIITRSAPSQAFAVIVS